MSTASFSPFNIPTPIHRTQFHGHINTNPPLFSQRTPFHKTPHFRCSKNLTFESSLQYNKSEDSTNSIIKGHDTDCTVDAIHTEENPPEIALLQSESGENVVQVNNRNGQKFVTWPMWILGPLILLTTGIIPTLWLPLSSIFLGSNMAGLLSLIGLDCIFNMGATMFLLMADACARTAWFQLRKIVPGNYRVWNCFASVIGFVIPLIMYFMSKKGIVEPHISFMTFLVLLGPYLLLLSVQALTEALTWHWRSPVWLIAPVVYEAYRILQLMRGISLAGDVNVNAPVWMVQTLRGLVSWWVLVLGIQLMRVSWFVGSVSREKLDAGDATDM